MSNSLVVKHLPSVLSDDSIKEFFQHYGAVDVKIMQGKMVCYLLFLLKKTYMLF